MKKNQNFHTIISCDPCSSNYYTSSKTIIKKIDKPKFLKKHFFISKLKTDLFLNTKIYINKNIHKKDHFDIIENRVYDELCLDISKAYKIDFYEILQEKNESNYAFNVFVTNPCELKKEFSLIIQQVKFIDYIYPVPLLMRSLYVKKIISNSQEVDVFIYFSRDDAFLTLYKDAHFFYTKKLTSTLLDIYEMFCDISNKHISYEQFKQIFINDDHNIIITELFNDIFKQIKDVINFAKSNYQFQNINKLYIGTSLGLTTSMKELAQTILDIKAYNFNFDYGLKTDMPYVDQIDKLQHVTALLMPKDKYDLNLTIFNRLPSFTKRVSGKLILLSASTILIFLILPLWYIAHAAFITIENDNLYKKERLIDKKKVSRKKIINTQKEIKVQLGKKIKIQKKLLLKQEDILTQIHKQKVYYPMKAKIITNLIEDFNKYGIKLTSLTYKTDSTKKENYFIFKLISENQKNITNMIKKLTKENLQNYEVTITEITSNEDMKNYISSLKVLLR